MIIAISGLSGCGNTTATHNVAKKTGLRIANYTFHDLAKEKGMSFYELQEKAKQEEQYDFILDKKQIEEAEKGDCVIGTRLACWLVDADLRVWLHASLKERAKRLSVKEENVGKSLKEVKELVKKRDKENAVRYKKLYGVNVGKYEDVVDLFINTERYAPEEVADIIVAASRILPKKKNRKAARIAKKIKQIIEEKTGGN